ncbi:MAG: o-succinylbenzoate synthase [bacterium]
MTPFRIDFKKFTLKFINPMGTSRGTLYERDTYIVFLSSGTNKGSIGLGECAPLKGLSVDARPDFARKLQEVCDLLNNAAKPSDLELTGWPAIRFGLETAFLDLEKGGQHRLFETDFTRGKQSIPINGLIFMAEFETMLTQVRRRIAAGFDCIKLKVGALDFDSECELLKEIRKRFAPSQIQIRLDANGALEVDSALEKIRRFSQFAVHSIEQPIQAGQWQKMAQLCAQSPIPIALDEELIGVHSLSEKEEILRTIKPQFIILKPTLLGGLAASNEWLYLANRVNIKAWITSALESNIGLNCISQWTSTLPCDMHQGLGTGQLFKANFRTPLQVTQGHLTYSSTQNWERLHSIADLKLHKIS